MDKNQIKRRIRNYLPNLPGDLLKIALMLAFVFPFYWMIITAFKTYNEAIQVPPTLWPQNFTFANFTNIMSKGIDITQYAYNSIVVTLSVIVLQLVVMVPAAYAFARFDFKGKGIFFGMVLATTMIPATASL